MFNFFVGGGFGFCGVFLVVGGFFVCFVWFFKLWGRFLLLKLLHIFLPLLIQPAEIPFQDLNCLRGPKAKQS